MKKALILLGVGITPLSVYFIWYITQTKKAEKQIRQNGGVTRVQLIKNVFEAYRKFLAESYFDWFENNDTAQNWRNSILKGYEQKKEYSADPISTTWREYLETYILWNLLINPQPFKDEYRKNWLKNYMSTNGIPPKPELEGVNDLQLREQRKQEYERLKEEKRNFLMDNVYKVKLENEEDE